MAIPGSRSSRPAKRRHRLFCSRSAPLRASLHPAEPTGGDVAQRVSHGNSCMWYSRRWGGASVDHFGQTPCGYRIKTAVEYRSQKIHEIIQSKKRDNRARDVCSPSVPIGGPAFAIYTSINCEEPKETHTSSDKCCRCNYNSSHDFLQTVSLLMETNSAYFVTGLVGAPGLWRKEGLLP